MEKTKKIKIFIALFYLALVCLFLYLFFSNFTLEEIMSYDFIKNNRDYFSELKQSNLLLLATLFIIFTIVWVFAAGFASPLAIFSGFVFGKWLGLLFLLFGMTIGATALYIFANYFLKEIIKEKFIKKFQNLENKFKKSEFIYLLIYRFIGGVPFAISNVLPCIFNVKVSNFFWATFLGLAPQLFLVVSIGNGLEKIIEKNLEPPHLFDLIKDENIYIPLIAFFSLIILTFILKKVFYKN
tara:strand:- start:96 stop:815 length:720 start_codon:yes stop_codon:yes gene_type:complete